MVDQIRRYGDGRAGWERVAICRIFERAVVGNSDFERRRIVDAGEGEGDGRD